MKELFGGEGLYLRKFILIMFLRLDTEQVLSQFSVKIYQTLVGLILKLVFWEEKHGLQTQGTEVNARFPLGEGLAAKCVECGGRPVTLLRVFPSCSDVLLRTFPGAEAWPPWLDAGCSRDDTPELTTVSQAPSGSHTVQRLPLPIPASASSLSRVLIPHK